MSGVRIVTDSSCDLTADEAAGLRVEVVPLSIRFGDEEFVDREELSIEDFYAKLSTSDTLPETAAPSPGAFEQRFRSLAEEGAEAIVCINISRALSATMEAAQQAARSIGDDIDVRVIDSKSITAGLGTMIRHAVAIADDGGSADDVVAAVEALSERTHVFGALDTLDNLKKGGRIGNAQALIGSLLSFKPILDLSSGEVEEGGRVRTRKKSLAFLRDKVVEAGNVEELSVMHANAGDIDDFVAMLEEAFPDQDIHVGWIGAVIGTHGGPGTIGLCWVDPA